MFRPLAVMEIVAKADDNLRIVAGNQRGEDLQCCDRIIGRQHHAPPRERRTLFQMKVGDDKQRQIGHVKAT